MYRLNPPGQVLGPKVISIGQVADKEGPGAAAAASGRKARRPMRPTWATGLAAVGIAAGAAADNVEDLKEEVAALRQRVAELEGRDGDQWLSAQRAAEIRGLVEGALADAAARTSLQGQSTSTGYDQGFVLSSADGNWLLRTNLLMQQRFVIDARQVNDRWGFENTRSIFTLSGNVVSPDWFYKVEINVGSNAGGEPAGVPGPGIPADVRTGTLDAYAGYDFGNGFQLFGGSFKAPLLREELVDSMQQQAVERSLVNYLFTTGRVDGIALRYEGKQLRVTGSYDDGSRTGQTAFGAADTRFSFTARGEYLFEGTWDQFLDITSPRGESLGILVGGGIHYQTEDTGAPQLDQLTLAVDGSFEFGGGNLFASFMYTDQDTTGATDGSQVGLVVQGGYYFSDTWEAYGRFEWADLIPTTFDDTAILTVGVNKYLLDHRAKWTTDIGIAFTEVRQAAPITGFQNDGAGQDGQVVLRTQLQVAF